MRFFRNAVFVFSICNFQYLHADMLPVFPTGYVVLESDLVVQGKTSDYRTFTVEKVLFGSAVAGQEIFVSNIDTLPRVAYEEQLRILRKPEEDKSTKDKSAVLFLKHAPDENGYESIYWGSGVNWIIKDRVYSYSQPSNPGPYVLLPDNSNPTVAKLFLSIENELKRRNTFEKTLAEGNITLRIEQLSKYLQPTLPSNYSSRAIQALQELGYEGSRELYEHVTQPGANRYRQSLIVAIGNSNDQKSRSFLITIIENSKKVLVNAPEPFDWHKSSEQQRQARNDFSSAIYALVDLDTRDSLPYFEEAAIWGAKNKDQSLVEYSMRGISQTIVVDTLATFEVVLASLPKEDQTTFGKFATNYTLRSLVKHRFRDAVPLLASQLDHPYEGNRYLAHKGLVEIVGEDLGVESAPWLQWHSNKE